MTNSQEKKIIRVQKLPKVIKEVSSDDILARFCLTYPQYRFAEAKRMPYPRIRQMLRVADELYYLRLIDQVEVSIAHLSKKGDKKVLASYLIERYKKMIKELNE